MQFGVLGPLEVLAGSRRVAVGGPQQRSLLALLLLNANRVVSVGWLVDELWGEQPPATARTLLHGCVAGLRRSLREDGRQPLLTRAPGYLLEVRPGELDLHRADDLEAAAAEALAAGSRDGLQRAAGLLTEALTLWRGAPLADVSGEACAVEAARLAERRLVLLERLADVDLRLGRFADLTGELRTHVRAEPLREPLWSRLVLALYAAGRQADALAAYREVRELLADQLGLDPGAQLQQLERAILAGAEVAALIRRYAGEPVGPAAEPALEVAAPGPRPAQLPAAVPAFTGRAGALRDLDAMLDQRPAGAVVSCALVGPGGIGKTALAVHWAHRVTDRFPDGQLYVNLRGYAGAAPLRPVEALEGFLRGLGVPAEQLPVEPEQAASLYRTLLAGKRMLVLLDNAAGADQVRPLLPGSPGCLVLVTSRDQLGGLVARDGARHLPLDVLTPAEATALLTAVLGDRVGAEPAAAAELARACGYLPLALRIAAANLAMRPRRTVAEQVAALATDRLAALQVAGDEQAAVRAAFDLSYTALPPAARRLFRLLGLVPGPEVTAPAATALSGDPAAGDLLEQLAAASLVSQPEPGRYGWHDLIAQYAAERAVAEASAEQRDAAIRQLLDWYLRGVDAAARLLYPHMARVPLPETSTVDGVAFEDQQGAVAWLAAERPNLLAAVEHAAAHGSAEAAAAIADGLRGYFWMRVHTVEWLAVAATARRAAEATGDLARQAAARLSAADAYLLMARYPRAADEYAAAGELAGAAGWQAGQATAAGNLGLVYRELGQLPEAAEHIARALAIDRAMGAVAGQAARLANLSNVYLELGRLPEVEAPLTTALALFRQLGSVPGEAGVLANLGKLAVDQGRTADAHRYLTEALRLHRSIGNRYNEAEALFILAEVRRDTGRPAEALNQMRAALALGREAGDRGLEREGRNILGTVLHRLGQYDRAAEEHQRALWLARETGAATAAVAALVGLANAHRGLGRLTDAAGHAREAIARAGRGGYRVLEGQARTALTAVLLDQGDLAAAADEGQQALELHQNTGHRPGEATTLLLLSTALRSREPARASALRRQAHELLPEHAAYAVEPAG
jgi:DNA-binding SARP family transcriptional activator/tetratricopeptide (TPR) repeat protein